MSAKRQPGGSEQRREPFAGRWLATIRGRIVAHGGTPDHARLAARARRFKEEPAITFMKSSIQLPGLVDRVRELADAQPELYLVGGAVRDLLLGRDVPDLDFAVPTGAIDLARLVANRLNADFVILDDARDTARVIVHETGDRRLLDFAGFRAGPSIEADLRARDFTVNALAMNVRDGTILDPLHGGDDLRGGILRACSPSALRDDPIRCVRAVRLAAALDFTIEAETRGLIRAAAGDLPLVSMERVRDELFRILAGRRVSAAIQAMDMLGMLQPMLQELTPTHGSEQPPPHVHDVWKHTVAVLRHLETILAAFGAGTESDQRQDLMTGLLVARLGRFRERILGHLAALENPDRERRSLLFFAALYHDVAKPMRADRDSTGRISFIGHETAGSALVLARGQALRLSTDECEYIAAVVANHMRFNAMADRVAREGAAPTRRSIYRLFRAAGSAGVDLCLLGLADLRGKLEHTLTQEVWAAGLDVARLLMENYWERPEESISPPRLVSGDDVMRLLGIPPGPEVGRILEGIREQQATGLIRDRQAALQAARTLLSTAVQPMTGDEDPET